MTFSHELICDKKKRDQYKVQIFFHIQNQLIVTKGDF